MGKPSTGFEGEASDKPATTAEYNSAGATSACCGLGYPVPLTVQNSFA